MLSARLPLYTLKLLHLQVESKLLRVVIVALFDVDFLDETAVDAFYVAFWSCIVDFYFEDNFFIGVEELFVEVGANCDGVVAAKAAAFFAFDDFFVLPFFVFYA